jgi:hypothetical protein
LHVFPQIESFNDSGYIDFDSGYIDLRNRIARGSSLRAVRGPILSSKEHSLSANWFRYYRFLLKSIAQKSARSINLSLTVARLFVSQASCEFLILRNCGMKGGISHASEESSGKESSSCEKGACEKGREEGAS